MAKKYRCEECGRAAEFAPGLGDCCIECRCETFEYREPRTNREALGDLVADGDDMTLVFMRERLGECTRVYLETPIEELRAEFGKKPNGLFAPGFADIYVRAAKEVSEGLRF